MDRNHEHWEHLAGYALGELPVDVRLRVEAHLAGCAECAREARELCRTFDAVGVSAVPIAPPPALRSRLLAQIESARARRVVSIAPPASASPSRRFSQPWLAAAAALLLVLGGMLALSQHRMAQLVEERRAAEASITRLTEEAAAVAKQADLAVAILTAPDMRRIDLQGFDVSRNATARAYWSGDKGLLIVADRLPAPPRGRIYQVWLIGAGAPGPVSAGLIDGRSGRGMLIVPAPGGLTGRSVTVAVTDEPDGGLPAPSGNKHLVGSM